ncbi:DUF1203 domain-containing protein [Massilia glaciei]|uniref:DUF1203 domain-containing protein n=2 Tax=Massilia glaciei TaxID=1524097 RepID=A0A2U2HIV9_9BURK|nr:DUF1203 domain-containing protein [Massilia glaciei]
MHSGVEQAAFKIVPLRAAFVERARTLGRDDQLQPVEHRIALGGEPCRDVLRRALPGEKLLLASYCPFEGAGQYREYGPVFILAHGSGAAVDPACMPASGEHGYFKSDFVLRAYGDGERIVDAVITAPDAAGAHLRALFGRAEIRFVLARFAAYGCYGCRFERA